MSLTVKAYLYRNGKVGSDSAEIRRFGLDEDVITSFDYLEKRIQVVFPNLMDKGLQLFWRDAEGDYIICSSDDELIEAVTGLQDGVFKIYITAKCNGEDSDEDKPDGMPGRSGGDSSGYKLHPGVTCDACEGPVRGMRYKCLQCSDYDLCRQCEGSGCHPDHDMIRIVNPGKNLFDLLSGVGGRTWGRGRGRGMFAGPGMFAGRRRRDNGNWWGMYPDCWGTGTGCTREGQGSGGSGRPQGAQTENMEEAASAETGEKPVAEGEECRDDWMRSVGEQVAAWLDPLGIDVEVDIENKAGDRQRCTKQNQSATAPSTTNTATNTATNTTEESEKANATCVNINPASDEQTDNNDDVAPTLPVTPQAESLGPTAPPPETAVPLSTAIPAVPLSRATPAVPVNTSTPAAPTRSSQAYTQHTAPPPSHGPVPVWMSGMHAPPPPPHGPFPHHPRDWRDWGPMCPPVMGGNMGPGWFHHQPAPGQTRHEQMMADNVARNLPARIQESLSAMRNMGFTNEGGWLTALLVAKDGDVDATLESLSPNLSQPAAHRPN